MFAGFMGEPGSGIRINVPPNPIGGVGKIESVADEKKHVSDDGNGVQHESILLRLGECLARRWRLHAAHDEQHCA
jgi:hypothetical protein